MVFHQPAVQGLKGRYADRTHAFDECQTYGAGMSGTDEHGSAAAAIVDLRCAVPVLDPSVQIQYRLMTPGRVARLSGKVVPIVFVSAHPTHQIDAGAAAEHLAHVLRNRAPVQVWIGLCDKIPVTLAAEVETPLTGVHDSGHIISAAGLK